MPKSWKCLLLSYSTKLHIWLMMKRWWRWLLCIWRRWSGEGWKVFWKAWESNCIFIFPKVLGTCGVLLWHSTKPVSSVNHGSTHSLHDVAWNAWNVENESEDQGHQWNDCAYVRCHGVQAVMPTVEDLIAGAAGLAIFNFEEGTVLAYCSGMLVYKKLYRRPIDDRDLLGSGDVGVFEGFLKLFFAYPRRSESVWWTSA